MSETLGIVTAEHCYLRKEPGCSGMQNESEIVDEIFSGWAVRLIGEVSAEKEGTGCERHTEKNGWVRVETHYGYKGYVKRAEIRLTDRTELQMRQNKARFVRIKAAQADLLSKAKVQGLPLELLLKNAVVEVLEREAAEGWSLVHTAAGREGYVHSAFLTKRKDDDAYLLGENAVSNGYFRSCWQDEKQDEGGFRQELVKNAMAYFGTQYRWGGKSSQGLDCSGLVFMSYLENGVLIYRDAKIMPDYPMREIAKEELKPGDAIYFPGHVAMYMGDGKYIHAAGSAKTPCVTINSLNPEDADYREDLAGKITAYGSIFGREQEC